MRKVILCVIAWIAVIVLIIFGTVYFTNDKSSLLAEGENLIALNRPALKAKISSPSKHPYMYFKFNTNQKSQIEHKINNQGNISVKVSVKILKQNSKADVENMFALGLLYADDFESSGKLNRSIKKRPLVTVDISTLKENEFSVSLCTDKEIPLGFFVYSTANIYVSEINFIEPCIGWDRRDGRIFFALGANGGTCDTKFLTADFTEAHKIFSSANSVTDIMPAIICKLSDCSDIGTWNNQKKIKINYANQVITIRKQNEGKTLTIQTSAFDNPYTIFEISEQSELVESVIMKANNQDLVATNDLVLYPITTDLGLILQWPLKNWRCEMYELYRWENFPDVLFFDFADYRTQNLFFTRLAFFVEKVGYAGTLISDEMVDHEHGYNAHDYKADDLANFFTKASKQQFKLNKQELILKQILIINKIILENKDGTYSSGNGAVVSISRESPRYLRTTFINHESWHGVYFTEEDFRDVVSTSYLMFDEMSMQFIKTFWETQKGLNYNINDEYLMRNEFMAYLMQQSVTNTKSYFLQIANRGSVNEFEPEYAAYIRKTNAEAFVDAALFLNDYVFAKWGLSAGRVMLISR